MHARMVIALLGAVVLGGPVLASPAGKVVIDPARARQYFEERRQALERDGGRLWGVRLDGPMLFVDPETREVVANQADGAGQLSQRGDVFTGRLPKEENIANTAIRWAGVEWTASGSSRGAGAGAGAKSIHAHETISATRNAQ